MRSPGVHMVRNSMLQDAAERLLLHDLQFRRTYRASRPAWHPTTISHADLLGALGAKDSDKAEKVVRGHLAASRQPLHPAI
jgi:GntR family transcriptional regulator, rspAB operon transcriptional repressor